MESIEADWDREMWSENQAQWFRNVDHDKKVIDADSLVLQNSDHPSMILVSALLTGSNYSAWSKSTIIALRA